MNIKSFGVIGGDKRQAAMAESIALDGYTVMSTGLEKASLLSCIQKASFEELVNQSEYIILPLPVTKDKKTINAPFADTQIELNEQLLELLKDKNIFCGMDKTLYSVDERYKSLKMQDYSKREEFSIRNAVPTAEGAIEIAMREYEGTINGSKCLVAGFGRIGKVLSAMLKGLGADVTVSARKPKDIVWIEILGYKPIKTQKICDSWGYDLIFNTIPCMIFDAHTLAKAAANSIVIDLASLPGGVDFEAAKRLSIMSIQALSLPGKVAPRSAGQIIKDTIYNIIKEGD